MPASAARWVLRSTQLATDLELLRAWRAGDQAAGERLFEAHADAIYGFFRGKVGEHAAEDLAHETFVACLDAEGFSGAGSFRAYLFRAARNRLYNFLSRDRARARATDPYTSSLIALQGSPSSVLHHRRDQRLLHLALQRLALPLQIAVELYYFEGLRGPDLAAALEIPLGTVRSRLRRARAQLLEALQAGHADGLDAPTVEVGRDRVLEALAQLPED